MPLVQHLLQYYFDVFHAEFPMVDKQWFMKEFNELLRRQMVDETTQWGFHLLLLSIICVMLQYTPSLKNWEDVKYLPEDLARICLYKARRILYENVEKSDILLVQAMIHLALSAHGRKGRAVVSWTFVGMAVRKSQEVIS
jgi:hypothetical protein